MDVLQHDYYFWRVVHHYVIEKGFRVLERRGGEVWLEDDESKPRRVLRIVRIDIDWANWLKRDVVTAVKRFELVRRQLRLSQLVGENIYISVYPPVDSWEEVQKPYVANQKKTMVYTTLVARHGQTQDSSSRQLMLPNIQDKESPEELELAIGQIKQDIRHVTKERENQERSLFLYGKPIATYILLLLIAAMFVVLEKNGGSTSVLTLIEYGAKYNPLIIEGEWWRFISAMFLHIGFLHLAMNSLALFYLGGAVERMYGTSRFLLIYFIAGVFGSIASFAFNEQVAAGASGAIFGCFGALLYFGTIHKKLFFRTMGKSVLMILALNLLFGFAVPMVDNGAHIGGLMGGYLASAAVQLPNDNRSYKQVAAFVVTGVAIMTLFWYGMENDQKTPSALLSLQIGQEYLQQDEIEKAYPFLKRAVEDGSEMPEATFLLAYAEASFENYETAKQLLLETINKRADFHEAHYNLALVYLELEKREEAQASVTRAVELKPDDDIYLDLKKRIDSN